MSDQVKYASRLRNKRVLIIGASSGLGYGVAEACLEHGSTVFISSSSQQTVDKTLASLRSAYPSATSRVAGHPCNLGDEATIEANLAALFEAAGQDGKLDHVVFTAGDALAITKVQDLSMQRIKQAGMVRFFAPLLVAKYMLPHVHASPDSSYTITSGGNADKPIAEWSIIASYLAGHQGMARNLALDIKPIRVNVVSPGFVDTPLWKIEKEEYEALKEHVRAGSTTGRVASVEDVVWTYLGVMSDSNVSGSVLESNSGARIV